MRRKSRLFALAEAMRGRRTGTTAEALAGRFGVTVRTIYRDLQALQAAGVPIVAERGRGGGYALDKNYSLPPVNFSAREAAVMLAITQAAQQLRTMPFTETLAAASDKVRAALSANAQRELTQLLGELQHIGVPALAATPAVQRAIETAWFERRSLRILYAKANGVVVPRHISIRNIVCERTQTLLNCLDHDLGQARQFRLHLIRSAQVLP